VTGLHGALSRGFIRSGRCSLARERVCAAPHLTPTLGGLSCFEITMKMAANLEYNKVKENQMATISFDTDNLIEICRENDVAMVGLFGSTSRGEETEKSDIDLLVKFAKRKSLLAVVKLERELSEALGKKVDLLTEAAISPYIRDSIFRDLKVIYDSP